MDSIYCLNTKILYEPEFAINLLMSNITKVACGILISIEAMISIFVD